MGEEGGKIATEKGGFTAKPGRNAQMLKKRNPSTQRSFLMPTLSEQCDRRHPLKKLGERIPWSDFEEAFGEYYSEEGRPAKPVRLMVGLLLLKQMYDQSDEEVVERWVENPYWQQFCGMSDFQWEWPCDASDLVYFRQRIGEQGVALILAVWRNCTGRVSKSAKWWSRAPSRRNVTYPVDTKQFGRYHAVLEASDKAGSGCGDATARKGRLASRLVEGLPAAHESPGPQPLRPDQRRRITIGGRSPGDGDSTLALVTAYKRFSTTQ